MIDIFSDRPYMTTRTGKSFHFIRKDNDNLICWEVSRSEFLETHCKIVSVNISDFHEKDLKAIGVWDNTVQETQTFISGLDDKEPIKDENCSTELNPNKSEKRKNNRFKSLPDVVTCKCGRETKANYSYLSSKSEKLGISLQQLIETYQCQKCNPTKGRKKNESTSSEEYPEFLICSCGSKVRTNIPQLSSKSKKLDVPIQKLIDNYQCQTCNPTKGRKKKQ